MLIQRLRQYSMFLNQLMNYLKRIFYVVIKINSDRNVSIEVGNMIIAMIVNIVTGYIILQLQDRYSEKVVYTIMTYVENVVEDLRSVLNWLMGIPAGFKLNKAFNNMLGTFFLYQINLWWMFLDLTREVIGMILYIYRIFGYLGVTLQAALLSDMLSFVTFHIYCIYVFIARLFNIQLAGLLALLRLFVGHKYNPLRKTVDSCEYTHQELFVGTVAFTILLFLLPTTLIYYTVFTQFRLVLLILQRLLLRLCYFMETLPLYVIILWLCRSNQLTGTHYLKIINKDDKTSYQKMRTTAPLFSCMKVYKAPLHTNMDPVNIVNLITCILRGELISFNYKDIEVAD